jgi:hypothetical protein
VAVLVRTDVLRFQPQRSATLLIFVDRNVGAVVPEIELPRSSRALLKKFTCRGTTVDDATDGAVCWALKKKQSPEIVSNTKSEFLVNRMAQLSSSFPLAENECWKNSNVLTAL